MIDHAFGRFMTHNLADYHVPVNADVDNIEVIFVQEQDEAANPLGAKGLGEIGIVGVAAAIANAVFHATENASETCQLRLISCYEKSGRNIWMSALHQEPHNREEGPMTALKAGGQAPDFSLSTTPDQKVSLSDFRGKPVVLVFYPADWSPVCSDQLALYNELKPEFSEFQAQILGISVDGVWCHLAFSKDRKLHFPLLADFEPKGAVARQYGVYRKKDGESERALFVIDAEGVIRWSYVSPVGINPGADGILQALESMAKGEKADSGRN